MTKGLFLSPAKINLFLHVVDKRPDGYHTIASLFQTIDLYDKIHFALSNRDHLTCTDPSIPTDAANLILKAAELFRRKTGLRFGVEVHLEKNIPHQSGLGGGSSNAATILYALNERHGKPASLQELGEWSSEIGSDISFFFTHGTAYCTGRGEIIREMPPLPKKSFWILKPPLGLSTPLVYRHLDLSKVRKRDPEALLKRFQEGEWPCFNDLEIPAFELLPELSHVKHKLSESGYHAVTMTGSGTALFCLGEKAPDSVPFARSVQFINRKPGSWF